MQALVEAVCRNDDFPSAQPHYWLSAFGNTIEGNKSINGRNYCKYSFGKSSREVLLIGDYDSFTTTNIRQMLEINVPNGD